MDVGEKALKVLALLEEVVQFKMKFYACTWAKYDEARPGSLRLLPPDHHLKNLEADYRSMRSMLFGEVPSFAEIINAIARIEDRINHGENTHP